MFIYFCEKCKNLEIKDGKENIYSCVECGDKMLPLECTPDEWNMMTNDEMLGVILAAQNKNRAKERVVIQKPVFSESQSNKVAVKGDASSEDDIDIYEVNERLIDCPECGRQVSKEAKKCPGCGYPIKQKKSLEKLNPKIIKRLVIALTVIIVISVIVILVIKSLFNPVQKAKNCYNKNDVSSFKAVELTKEERAEINDYLSGECDRIKNEYIAEKKTASEAISELSHIREYLSDYHAYNSAKNYIDTLEKSRSQFSIGMDEEKNNNYAAAIEAFSDVVSDDKNYEEAQQHIEQNKSKAIESYKTEAKNAAEKGEYSKAIDTVEKARKLDSSDKTLDKLLDEYRADQKKKEEKDEADRKKMMTLSKGTSFSTTHLNVTFKSAELTKSVYPDVTSGYYSYYSVNDNNNIWLDLKFRIKNISSNEMDMDEFISGLECTYGDSYTYNSYGCFYSNSDNIDKVYMWDDLDPLNEVTFHVCIELPEEAQKSGKSIVVDLKVDGTEKVINVR